MTRKKETAEEDLWRAVITLKMDLSLNPEAYLDCQAIYGGLDWEGKQDLVFTRAELETAMRRAGILDRLMRPVLVS